MEITLLEQAKNLNAQVLAFLSRLSIENEGEALEAAGKMFPLMSRTIAALSPKKGTKRKTLEE